MPMGWTRILRISADACMEGRFGHAIGENMKRSLVMEDFGKIRKAKIDISPLTLFVGDYNSGKS